MDRRAFVHRSALSAAGFGILRTLAACAPPQRAAPPVPLPADFTGLRDRYFLFHLERNPVTATYLGGDGYSPTLANINARLRDYRPQAIADELRFYRETLAALQRIPVATLSAQLRVDHQLMQSQLEFLIHLLGDLQHHQRAIDTYVAEPFRGIDWQIQQMTNAGAGMLGTAAEWEQVVTRALAVPVYLETAKANLLAGKAAGRIPDRRMVQRDGIGGSRSNAEYFRTTLPATAQRYMGSRDFAATALNQVRAAGAAAANAWEAFATFLEQTYDANETVDRYAVGEAEYAWRVKNVLRDPRTPAELYEYGAAQVALYTARMVEVAREFARQARMPVSPISDPTGSATVRAVMDFLSKDSPRNDEQLFRWYRDAATRAIAYGRQNELFDVPADYRLDIVPTPPVLRSTIDAAYYPAPPFKKSGVGRFYLTPTDNDPAQLRQNPFASVADLAVHEGFPGHDWHYKYMTANASEISNIRWLTPGAVEDSSSMWSDSMAAEGWALYAEELMAEPVSGKPHGFYSRGEYLYELQGQLLRAVRVRVDVGLHTGRMSFDEAMDYFIEHVSFAPGARARAAGDANARAIADNAMRAIYRYSKWPTQAITYNIGKNAIIELREAYKAQRGPAYSPKEFHERFMRMGTVPVAYFRGTFLAESASPAPAVKPDSTA